MEPALLREKGAVCAEVAEQMAQGVRRLLHADFALSVTGNAGPGADEKNPRVGEIFIACAASDRTVCSRLELSGSREENRSAACQAALQLLLEEIS